MYVGLPSHLNVAPTHQSKGDDVGQDEVNVFIEAWKELQIIGLDNEMKGNQECVSEKLSCPQESENQEEKLSISICSLMKGAGTC